MTPHADGSRAAGTPPIDPRHSAPNRAGLQHGSYEQGHDPQSTRLSTALQELYNSSPEIAARIHADILAGVAVEPWGGGSSRVDKCKH